MKIKNLVKIVLSVLLFSTLFNGCASKQSNVNNKAKSSILSSDNSYPALAYAYMKGGDKLEYITFNYEGAKDGYDVIKINPNGFYPDYDLTIHDIKGGLCLVNMSGEPEEVVKFCKSSYTSRDLAGSGIVNAIMTVGSLGLNVATGAILDSKFFDEEHFSKAIKDNNLSQVRTKINELKNLETLHNKDLYAIYDNELDKYRDNMKNIEFKYTYTDKSGLLFGKKLDPNLEVSISNKINSNLPVYSDFYKNEKFNSVESFVSFIDNLSANLNNQIESSKSKYRNEHLKNMLSEYVISNYKSEIRLNSGISYNVNLDFPKTVKYEYGVKKVVPVNIVVNSANIRSILPASFILKDKNITLDFKYPRNTYVDVIGTNETNTFLTIRSLTSYINKDVYTSSNSINREIAPLATTLDSNSSYSLFSSNMIQGLSFSGVTRSTLPNKSLEYGFAVKYHIQDSNIEKTIFNKKKYTYLQLVELLTNQK